MTKPEFVRRLEPTDLERGARLFARVFASEPWNEPWTAQTAGERLGEVMGTPGYLGFVCEREGEPVALVAGCVARQARGNIFYVHEMCVRPQDQGKGLGGRLLDVLHEELDALGVGRVVLLTMSGGSAESFYRRHGYERDPSVVMLHRSFDG